MEKKSCHPYLIRPDLLVYLLLYPDIAIPVPIAEPTVVSTSSTKEEALRPLTGVASKVTYKLPLTGVANG